LDLTKRFGFNCLSQLLQNFADMGFLVPQTQIKALFSFFKSIPQSTQKSAVTSFNVEQKHNF